MPLPTRSLTLIAALALAFNANAQDASAQRTEVTAAANRLDAKITAWRRDFHTHPELSNREERTSAKVASTLAGSLAAVEP